MAERTHSVRLRLEVGQLRQDAAQASQAITGIGSAARGVGTQARGMETLGRVARGAGQVIASVGTVAAGAMGALGLSVIKTGIEYNTLEQTSRAALTTLLGSAEAASAQMDKLREFGRSSPFPRQVWIQAQQQLLAFGMAAEEIIPTLGAIQDAVAAAGGSAVDISEVVRVLAQVQSTGKATAETLNQLGVRGIDAATLIGDAMGKTAAEIREDVSSGALDAATFLGTLTDAMSTRFGGAAENVKNTWLGATDRIKGALRDIGSAIAEPFVDPAGGGAAVGWANDVADALRGFEAALRPAMDVLARRAQPALEATSAALEKFGSAMEGVDLVGMFDTIARGAPAFAGLGAAIGVVGLRGLPVVGALSAALGPSGPLIAGLTAAALASPELRQALLDLLMALAPLVPAAVELADVSGQMLTPTLSALVTAISPLIDLVGLLATGINALPEPITATVVSLLAMTLLGPKLMAFGGMLLTPFQRLREEMALQRGLHSQVIGGYQQLGDETRKAAPQLSNFGAAAAVASRGLSGMKAAASGLVSALGGPVGVAFALAAAAPLLDALADKAVKAAFTGFDPLAGSISDVAEDLERFGRTGRVTGELVDVFGGNMDGLAERFHALDSDLNATQEALAPFVQDWGDAEVAAEDAAEAFTGIDKALAELVEAGNAEAATAAVQQMAEAIGLSEGEIGQLLAQLPEYQRQMERHNERTRDAAEGQEGLAGATEEATNAMRAQADEMRAQVDPIFALNKAIEEAEAAQDAYNEAVEEHGPNSQEAATASLDLLEAAIALAGAAGDASGAFNGELTPSMRSALEAMGATDAQIDAVEATLRGLIGQLNNYEGNYAAGVSLHGAGAVAGQLDYLTRPRSVYIGAHGPGSLGIGPSGGARIAQQFGGPVVGPPGLDAVDARLTAGEHVWTVKEVQAAGGHSAMEAMRAAVLAGTTRFAVGAPVGIPSPVPVAQSGGQVDQLGMARMVATAVGRSIDGARLVIDDHGRGRLVAVQADHYRRAG